MAGRCPLANWSHDVDQWIIRLNCLSRWYPELELPMIDAEARLYLIQQICHGAISYKEIKERNVWPVVKSWLSPAQQQALDHFAPPRYELPNGRHAKLQYTENQSPVLAARIQDLYGLNGSLKICEDASRFLCTSSLPIIARSKSLRIYQASGKKPIQRSNRNCSASTRSTNGARETGRRIRRVSQQCPALASSIRRLTTVAP